jgi:hypothetical protein
MGEQIRQHHDPIWRPRLGRRGAGPTAVEARPAMTGAQGAGCREDWRGGMGANSTPACAGTGGGNGGIRGGDAQEGEGR